MKEITDSMIDFAYADRLGRTVAEVSAAARAKIPPGFETILFYSVFTEELRLSVEEIKKYSKKRRAVIARSQLYRAWAEALLRSMDNGNPQIVFKVKAEIDKVLPEVRQYLRTIELDSLEYLAFLQPTAFVRVMASKGSFKHDLGLILSSWAKKAKKPWKKKIRTTKNGLLLGRGKASKKRSAAVRAQLEENSCQQ
jgi:hypothetical protein